MKEPLFKESNLSADEQVARIADSLSSDGLVENSQLIGIANILLYLDDAFPERLFFDIGPESIERLPEIARRLKLLQTQIDLSQPHGEEIHGLCNHVRGKIELGIHYKQVQSGSATVWNQTDQKTD